MNTLLSARGVLDFPDFFPSTPSEINSPNFCWNPLPWRLSFSIFSLLCTQGVCEFEDGIDAWALCQMCFREICSLLNWQNTRDTSHLSLAHCSCLRRHLQKSTVSRSIRVGFMCELTNQMGWWRITHLMPGLSCSHGMTWLEATPAETHPPLPKVLLFTHCLGISAGSKITTYVSEVLFCVCSPPKIWHFIRFHNVKWKEQFHWLGLRNTGNFMRND